MLAILSALISCVDPPLYETPLPNGYAHHSNGGHFGIVTSPDNNLLAQLAIQDDGSERWCNKFGVHAVWVICEIVDYGENTGMKNEVIGYLILETASGRITEYPDLGTAALAWTTLTSVPMPVLAEGS